MKPLIEVSPGQALLRAADCSTPWPRLVTSGSERPPGTVGNRRVASSSTVGRPSTEFPRWCWGAPEDHQPAIRWSVSPGRRCSTPTCVAGTSGTDLIAAATTIHGDGAEVLATAGGRPVWTSRGTGAGTIHEASLVPAELGATDTLHSRLVPGRFFDLLPLIHFLRRLPGVTGWTLPAPRAAFIMDDPNLHADRYGYLDLAEMATRASHLTVATVPFDRWFTRSGTARNCSGTTRTTCHS